MLTQEAIVAADRAIRPQVRETPAEQSPYLSELGQADVYLKLENFQQTGSFKVRGAMNKLMTLDEETRQLGVVAASSGNHGAAVAFGARELGCSAMLFVPEHASSSKVETIRRYGAEVVLHGQDCIEAETQARAYAKEHKQAYLSPYNDKDVIAGQGTVAVELERQAGSFDAVFVALGGGGLISGVGSYLKSRQAETQIVACSPERSPAMHASLKAGSVIDVPSEPTLSDGTAGGLEADTITFELCREVVGPSYLVSETEIKQAMQDFMRHHRMLIEGAAGVALAAYLQNKDQYRGKRVAIVICGANISLETLQEVLV